MTVYNNEKCAAMERIAAESPFTGERAAAAEALKRTEGKMDPRLSRTQRTIVNDLTGLGFKVSYEFGSAKYGRTIIQ